jgi:hypothetical protein
VSLANLVTLTPVDPPGPPLRFHLNGDDEVSGGVGGWEVVPRPRRKASVEWVGVTQPWTLALPLITDGLDVREGDNRSVEPKLDALIFLAQVVPGGSQPPVLTVSGPVRVRRPNMRWVIQSFEWGAQVRRSDQARVQQMFTVNLLEYVAAEILLGPAARARARR